MKCFFFGHKFGIVRVDGFQYCEFCGQAKKPSVPHPCENGHLYGKADQEGWLTCTICGKREMPSKPYPCANGHIWKDTGEAEYYVRTFNGFNHTTTYYVPQKCVGCGERRSVSKY